MLSYMTNTLSYVSILVHIYGIMNYVVCVYNNYVCYTELSILCYLCSSILI